MNDDGVHAKDVLASNTTNDGTFAVVGVEPGTIDMYSSYVVNQGDYKYGKWVLTGLEDTDWTDEQKKLVEDAVRKANREQSPVLNISGLADGTLIHTFTWFKNAIYWMPYDNGKLTVSKTISGNALESDDATDEFTFKITLTGEDIPTGKQTYGVQGVGSDIADKGVTFTDGVAEIKLKGGESKTIEGIPAGTSYTVEEKSFSDPDDKLTYTTSASSATGTIEANKEATAAFTNSKQKDEPPTQTTVTTTKRPLPQTGDDTASGAGLAATGMAALLGGLALRRKRRLS